jgi:hypothetical protein
MILGSGLSISPGVFIGNDNTPSPPPATLTIGDSLGGGTYIGTTRSISDVVYNLILSPYIAQSAEQTGTDLTAGGLWPETNKKISGTSDFDGYQNTNYIPTTPNNSTGTANYFGNLVVAGYDDWYWPSHQEMVTLSNALNTGLLTDEKKGPFLNSSRYWSSTTEFATLFNPTRFVYYAWAMDGNASHTIFRPFSESGSSMTGGRVRCVRRQLP